MTQPDDDMIREIARGMVIDAIEDEYHYRDALAEQLEDYETSDESAGELVNGVPVALIERLRTELQGIREHLAESWGML